MPGCSKDPKIEEERRRKLSVINKEKNKGKTYEELYGPKKAQELRRQRKEAISELTWSATRGKSLEEIHGVKRAQEIKEAIRHLLTNKVVKLSTREKLSKIATKYWADKKNPENRGDVVYHSWREAVLKRDNYVCQHCQITLEELADTYGVESIASCLQAHHIKSWNDFPELRYVVSNGLTLCISCHMKEERRLEKLAKVLRMRWE